MFHRVDDIYQMNGPDFFRKAYRLSFYEGVMKMRLFEQINREDAPRTSSAPARAHGESDVQEMTAAAMAVVHPDLFEMSTA